MSDQTGAEATDTPPGMSKTARNYMLGMLALVYAINFIDRQIIVVIQEALKGDLSLSDTQLGFLSGFAFAAVYVTLGLPVAAWADRSNRRNIISLALFLWSGFTALCGLAQSYGQFLMARIGVGIGESGASPPAHSMISDAFPEEKRATALAIYSAGLYVGVLFGFLLGGYLASALGWRMTLILLGLPGIALALILRLTVKEPARRLHPGQAPRAGVKSTLRVLAGRRSFPFIALGCAFAAFIAYGLGNFAASFFIRYHGLTIAEAGLALSLTTGVSGIIGTFSGGWITDKFGRSNPGHYLWLPAMSAVLSLPLYVTAFQTADLTLALVCLFFAGTLASWYLAPSIAMTHRLVPANMRAVSSAILFFVLNLIGLGLGPVFIGFLSDQLLALNGRESLREALCIGLLFVFVKAGLFLRGGVSLRRDLLPTDREGKTV